MSPASTPKSRHGRALLRAALPAVLVLTMMVGSIALAACGLGADRCRGTGASRALQAREARRPPALVPHVIPLLHARAGEVAHTLQSLGRPGRHGRELRLTDRVRIAPYHHGNALLVVSNAVDAATLRTLVASLDVQRRRLRLQISLVEGRLSTETVGGIPEDRGGHPTGRHLLTSQRVLETTPLLLAEGQEQALSLSPSVAKQVGCLWGEGPPALSVSARLGSAGSVEIALHSNAVRRAPARPPGGQARDSPSASRLVLTPAKESSSRMGRLVLAVALRRTAAVAFVPEGHSKGLGPGFRLAEPPAEGFVVPSRCAGAEARTHLLVITPSLLEG